MYLNDIGILTNFSFKVTVTKIVVNCCINQLISRSYIMLTILSILVALEYQTALYCICTRHPHETYPALWGQGVNGGEVDLIAKSSFL
ncbi:hypothetical protein XELAEV_18008026mg [Xenopus laevis]|uniref:Uncharacterized protein n=1 Tax=Xenopus laevis TaxID=8355 RepID=A0A974E1U8_XENLA|nr:hypothetical protein XELAEV_18008026mg [Xenopus laevis]